MFFRFGWSTWVYSTPGLGCMVGCLASLVPHPCCSFHKDTGLRYAEDEPCTISMWSSITRLSHDQRSQRVQEPFERMTSWSCVCEVEFLVEPCKSVHDAKFHPVHRRTKHR
ncbi:hypothetical protein EDB86DRAFT_1125665 [Lactarius hatsudake]|nr:hypothetical protein EDB86DRAFT_513199 [Lactarius hatsudake]KAH9005721.1 hypothetical protein EDB86DRAFT_1125665 [Lactarius hatsudake]